MITISPFIKSFRVDFPKAIELDVTYYMVHASKTQGFSPTSSNLIYKGPDNTVFHTVTEGGMWYLRMAAVDIFGEDLLNYSSELSVDVPTLDPLDLVPPNVPTGLALTTALDNSAQTDTAYINATWNANTEDDFSHYVLHLYKTSTPALVTEVQVEKGSTSHKFQGLITGLSYSVKIKAVDQWKNSSVFTAASSVTTSVDTVAPATPTGLTATPGYSSIFCKWNKNTEPDLAVYEVYSGATSGFTPDTTTFTNRKFVGNALACSFDVARGTASYYVKVCAVDHSGNRSGFVTSSVVSFESVPAAPSGVVNGNLTTGIETDVNGVFTSFIKIAFTDGVVRGNGFSYYEYRIKPNGGNYIYFTGLKEAEYTFKPVHPNVVYYVGVRAVSDLGLRSAYCSDVSITSGKDSTAPGLPTSTTATGGIQSNVLKWVNPADKDLSKIYIYRNTTNNSGTAVKIAEIDGTSYFDKDVVVGTTYYYWFKSIDTSGNLSTFTSVVSCSPVNISASDLANSLSSRIDLIDAPTIGLVAKTSTLESDLVALRGYVNELVLPEYDNTASYVVDDTVRYEGGVYRCILASNGNLPTNVTYWVFVSDFTSLADTVAQHTVDITGLVNTYGSTVAAATSATQAANSASSASTSATQAANSASSADGAASTANTAASSASSSASGASTSQTNAAGSALDASNSASAAAVSASTATTKAGEAATSATSAQSSANVATTKAGEASTSAANAATSATNAAGSASSASTYATNAATSATSAGDSATAANTSASLAATKATEAATSAATATTQAGVATTKAGEASTSATASAASATSAAGSASTANTAASNAATSATNAGNSASAASTSASSAATSATSASSSATSATSSANTATTKAGEASTSAGSAATSATNAAWSATTAQSWASLTAKTGSMINNPFFEAGKSFWSLSSSGETVADTTIGTIVNGVGSNGGKVWELTGSQWVFWGPAIPVNTSKTYRGKFRVRQTVDQTSGGSVVYAGLATLDVNYQNLTGGAGTHRYFIASSQTITVANGWREYTGTISGIGDLSTNFRAGTVYVRPMFIVNYSAGNGTVQVDALEFFDDSLSSAITTETTARTTADTTLTNSINTLSSQVNNATTGLPAAHSNITTVSNTVATKGKTFYQPTQPTATATGDLWINSSTKERKVWDGAAWVDGTDTTRASASSVTTLTSQVNGIAGDLDTAETSIQTLQTTTDGLKAQYTVKIDNNGFMTGFGLASDIVNGTPFSEFMALADRFAIINPSTAVKTISGITRTTTTATATSTSHGYLVGDNVVVTGAAQNEYNGTKKITGVTANTFDYTVTGTPTTPATLAAGFASFKVGKTDVPFVVEGGLVKMNSAYIKELDAGKINTGTLDAARIAAGSLVVGKLDSSTQTNITNGSTAFSGTTNYRTTGVPTNNPSPTGITITTNTNGTCNIRLDWSAYTQGAKQADFLMLFWRKDGTTPTVNDSSVSFNVNTAAASYYVFEGVNPADTYSFGIAAARRTESGLEIGAIQCPTSAPDWLGVTSGTPNYTANLNGTTASTVVSNASNGNSAWGKFSGSGGTLPQGNVEFNFAGSSTKGGSANNTTQVGTQSATNVQNATINFNARNDRNAVAVVAPTVSDLAATIDHTINSDGSCDLSFEWAWGGVESDIDGFIVYLHDNGVTTPVGQKIVTEAADATVQVYYVTPQRRSFIAYGVAADHWYTFGVQAYRIVDPDVDATGVKKSSVVQPLSAAVETTFGAYRPTSNIAFTGNITGTINGTSAATVVTNADNGNTVYTNPAARINALATTVDPGKILVSGATTLADWRHGSDNTKIDGGDIYANSITANKLSIGNRNISIQGIEISANYPVANTLYWGAGVITYVNDSGTTTTANISASSVLWSTGTRYLYWTQGGTVLQTTTTASTAFGANNIVLASYRGGTDLVANYGRTIVDGSYIVTGTITADRIATGTITASQIAAGTITADRMNVTDLSAISANIGTITAGTINATVSVNAGAIKAGTITGQVVNLGETNIKLDGTNSRISISDGTISDKIILGKIASNNYGLYVKNAAGQDAVKIDNDGAVIQNVTVQNLVGNTINGLTINAANINAGTLSADRIGAGSIRAEHLAVGFGVNILKESAFRTGPWEGPVTGWTLGQDGGQTLVQGRNLAPEWSSGEGTYWLQQVGRLGNSSIAWIVSNSNLTPVIVGKKYIASVYTGAHRCKVYIYMQFLNSSGVVVGTSTVDSLQSVNDDEFYGGQYLNYYKRVYSVGTAPTGAVTAYVAIIKEDTKAGFTDSYMFCTKAMLEEAHVNQTTPSSWSEGSFTYINGDSITSGTITGRTLQTAASGKRFVIDSTIGEAKFYDTDGTELASIGLKNLGGDIIIGAFGHMTSGNSKIGLGGQSYSGNGVEGHSYSAIGVNCSSYTGKALTAEGNYGYGAWLSGATAPLQLSRGATTSAPTHAAGIGSVWLTSNCVMYVNTNGSTAWQKVGAQ